MLFEMDDATYNAWRRDIRFFYTARTGRAFPHHEMFRQMIADFLVRLSDNEPNCTAEEAVQRLINKGLLRN